MNRIRLMADRLASSAAHVLLLGVFGTAWLISWAGRRWGVRGPDNGTVLVTGTFYNHGWFLSHAMPLARSGLREVVFVADEPQPAPEGVRFVCPPKWAARLFTRAGAKFLWMVKEGFRVRAGLCMGFHLFPGGLSALIAARVLRCAACYQMTGGPLEIEGGGWACENPLLVRLGRPRPALERLAAAVMREFELVVTRGSRAKQYVAARGVNGSATVITGSVVPAEVVPPWSQRPIDLVFVGRMTGIKQPRHFVRLVARLAEEVPGLRATMIGDGPDLESVRAEAVAWGVEDRVQLAGQRSDVRAWLLRSKVFVLTSRSEGLSIAMAEAMSCGVPVVVANVGDLADLVSPGVNGWLVPPDDIRAYAEHIRDLITQPEWWARFSKAAHQAALQRVSVESVAHRWREAFRRIAAARTRHEGHAHLEVDLQASE